MMSLLSRCSRGPSLSSSPPSASASRRSRSRRSSVSYCFHADRKFEYELRRCTAQLLEATCTQWPDWVGVTVGGVSSGREGEVALIVWVESERNDSALLLFSLDAIERRVETRGKSSRSSLTGCCCCAEEDSSASETSRVMCVRRDSDSRVWVVREEVRGVGEDTTGWGGDLEDTTGLVASRHEETDGEALEAEGMEEESAELEESKEARMLSEVITARRDLSQMACPLGFACNVVSTCALVGISVMEAER